ncbi:MAG TPA: SRPBCC family protein [Gemmatimonadaceae bacterium]|nr:SRPBCC family protein [Gemmatimonadaceae bacterium]
MQAMSGAEVRVEVVVKAPIERAFQVFTERADSWWPRSHRLGEAERTGVVLEPRVGGRWYERGADGSSCDWGRVLVWDPPRHLVLAWQIGVGFKPESDPLRASRVDIRFAEDAPGQTRVTLVHSGFERHGAGWESLRDGVAHEGGWPGILAIYAEVAGS